MPQYVRRNSKLQDRDYEILSHVMRYRLTTPEVLHRMPFFDESERNAVTKVTSRLVAEEFLLSHQLYGSNVYFTIGSAGAPVTGLKQELVGPLGPKAVYTEYGTLAFCCLGEIKRERLRIRELNESFPNLLIRRTDKSHYYFDLEDGVRRLGYIWTEAGGTARHVADVVERRIINPRKETAALRDSIEDGRFVVSVVTFTEEKRLDILDELAKIRWQGFVRVEVVPELLNLLPRTRDVRTIDRRGDSPVAGE